MKKIAIICGGDSVESEISCLTSLKIAQELKKSNFPFLLIFLDKKNNYYLVDEYCEDFIKSQKYKKGQFKKKKNQCYFQVGLKKHWFDYLLILGHGKNLEDGKLSNYFSQMGFPILSESSYNGVIIQDKVFFKHLLRSLGFNVIPFEYLYNYQKDNDELIDNIKKTIDSDLIIKPSCLGSSIGVSLVKKNENIKKALYNAFLYDNKVIIEKCIKRKKELNIAIIGYQDDITFSNIEEVNDQEDLLSFYDKYDYSCNNKKRIIKPNIKEKLKNEICTTALDLYKKLNICGLVRFDFIYDVEEDILYLSEINLVPGSLAYYLFEDKYNLTDLIIKYIGILEKKYLEDSILLNKYMEGFINKIDLSKLKK